MLATKNQFPAVRLCALVALGAVFGGCSPSAPRSVIEADHALRRGEYPRAIEKLKRATELLPEEPRAWNLLGVAYHNSAQPQLAAQAYRQALARDRSNVVAIAHFNLGCLLLEENNPAAAADELRSFTLLTNSPTAWTKLGNAQLRLRQYDAAERSFATALRIEPKSVEALNGLGVINAQRNRTLQALQFFNASLQLNRKYAPALMNSGLVAQQTPATRHIALQRFREYIAIRPSPPAADAALGLARQLEAELRPPPAVVSAPVPPSLQATQATKRIIASSEIGARTQPPKTNLDVSLPVVTRTNVLTATPVAKPALPTTTPTSTPSAAPAITNLVKSPAVDRSSVPSNEIVSTSRSLTNLSAARSDRQPRPSAKPDIVKSERPPEPTKNVPLTVVTVTSTPPVRMASAISTPTTSQTNAGPAPREIVRTNLPAETRVPVAATASEEKPKISLLTRLNPFRRGKEKAPGRDAGRIIVVAPAPGETPAPEGAAAPAEEPKFPRYSYVHPAKPSAGDRHAAEIAVQRALAAQRTGKTNQAILEYGAAVAADPSYRDAQYNLALLLMETGNWSRALAAWEMVLALAPDSINARYNFALTLKQSNYLHDAAAELEEILSAKPEEARAHLTLGNLYAQQLEDVPRAREHYRKVLELDSHNPQAAAIRFWLAANQ